jgi:glycosyltransferase involved in cell wall biosynthesis
MDRPVLFSIVVPTYNRAHIISSTIESILAQAYIHFEIIIVDDGSTDDTEQVVAKYLSEKVFYYKKANAERGAARNFGTAKSKGDYVNWFDSDDIMSPDNLMEAAQNIHRNGMVEIIIQGYKYIDGSGKLIHQSNFSPNVNQDMYKANQVVNSPVMVRRDIAIDNPYNEDRELSGSEDYELWLRLAAKYHFYPSKQRTVLYIHHDERSTVTMNASDQFIKRYEKFLFYTTSNPEVSLFLGAKKGYFIMKTYLLLAVDLIINKHKKPGIKYLFLAFRNSPNLIFERGFYAFIKHFLLQLFSFD